MHSQGIPIVNLKIQIDENKQQYSESILENEIKDIHVEHVALASGHAIVDASKKGYKSIYLFVKGKGQVIAENTNYEIVPETIFLPNIVDEITIKTAKGDTLHYLKISSKLTAQDLLDLEAFPSGNTQYVYYAKFSDCQSYTEPIKSPNTVSRTILPNKYIPRIAMGTVQAKGPDKVGAHEHPMLEQLFLGLSKNNCMVYADDANIEFPQYAVLHIPLGSNHSVSVEKGEVMHYVWMDFFLDKKGEDWLKTHIVDSTQQRNYTRQSRCHNLAYRIYPEPNGTEYFEPDLATEKQVIELFDYCQILQAIITKEGWLFLIDKYGFEKLYELNNESGWMDCESLSEFKSDIREKINREA